MAWSATTPKPSPTSTAIRTKRIPKQRLGTKLNSSSICKEPCGRCHLKTHRNPNHRRPSHHMTILLPGSLMWGHLRQPNTKSLSPKIPGSRKRTRPKRHLVTTSTGHPRRNRLERKGRIRRQPSRILQAQLHTRQHPARAAGNQRLLSARTLMGTPFTLNRKLGLTTATLQSHRITFIIRGPQTKRSSR